MFAGMLHTRKPGQARAVWAFGLCASLPYLYYGFYNKDNFYITVFNCQDSCQTCFSSNDDWGRSYTMAFRKHSPITTNIVLNRHIR